MSQNQVIQMPFSETFTQNCKLCKIIDNNVTEGNAVLVFCNIVFTNCYRQITYFFVCYIVARNLNF